MLIDRYHSGRRRCRCPLGPMFPARERRLAYLRAQKKRALRRLLASLGLPVPPVHVLDWMIEQRAKEGR